MRRRATTREIEIKLPVADLRDILRRLRRLATPFRGRVFEQNTLYDTPDSAFRRAGYLLRIRLETPAPGGGPKHGKARGVLTVKFPAPLAKRAEPSRYKERSERELTIRDPRHRPGLLHSLGLRPSFRYEKYRTTFRLPSLYLDLDETPVGVFLELEGEPAAIDRAARALGFSSRDYFRGTYWDVYAADCRRRGRPVRNMVFSS
jgi:adenylate cyclase class 2